MIAYLESSPATQGRLERWDLGSRKFPLGHLVQGPHLTNEETEAQR